MNTLAASLRRNLSQILAKRGFSQRGLAEKMGIAHPYLSRVLAGQSVPTLTFVEKISVAIGVDPLQLLKNARKARKNTTERKFNKCS